MRIASDSLSNSKEDPLSIVQGHLWSSVKRQASIFFEAKCVVAYRKRKGFFPGELTSPLLIMCLVGLLERPQKDSIFFLCGLDWLHKLGHERTFACVS